MLIGIHPLLNAEILHVLASMGHGDDLVICDGNFPAAKVAKSTAYETPIQMGVGALEALEAILTVFPIDTFDLDVPPVRGMQVVDAPDEIPPIIAEAEPMLKKANAKIKLIERHAFYESSQNAFAVVRTIESRHYGNFILRKGVV